MKSPEIRDTAPAREKPYTVGEITRLVKRCLEDAFPPVWIEGEVSNLKRAATGHAYFTLKDASSQISAVMFRSSAARALTPDIVNGVQVRVYGEISVYERSGRYQVVCRRLEKVGLGELQLRFLELKEKLYKKGWFDPALKKPLPFLPERVALVTSPTGAAVRDMLNILYTRWPNLDVLVVPVKVQGEGAAEAVAEAIRYLNREGSCSVMIVGRGGGSIEDLWAFNELVVAEAIHESEIPVVSAVGHEVDFTISDFTADARAETPSAAAAMVVPVRAELEERLSEMETLLRQNTGRTLQGLFDRLESFRNHYLFREPATKIRECVQRLDELSIALKTRMENGFVLKREALRRAGDLLQSLSPFAVLERGYSITRAADSGKTVRRAGDVRAGELLVTRLFEGEVYSEARENPGKTGGKTAGKDSR